MVRWLSYTFAALLALSLIAFGIIEAFFRSQIKPLLAKDVAQQERYFQPFLEDQVFLSRTVPFMLPKKFGQADAGPYLNSRVYWAPLREGLRKGASHPLVTLKVREDLLRLRGGWMKKYERVKHLKIDLSIFNGLEKFDYWDIEVESPISDLMGKRWFIPPPQLPMPDVADLLVLTKIRLMKGALEEDYLAALKDVRKLATLLLTAENTQLAIAGLAALENERTAYLNYVEDHELDSKAWVPVERNALRRAHRTILAARAYLHLWTKPQSLAKIFLGANPPIGFCAAANDAFPLEYSVRSRLEPAWPFERSLKAEYSLLDKIYNRAKLICRLRYLVDLVESDAFHPSIPGPFILNRLPYARRIYGLRASAINFTGLNAYAADP